MVILDEKSTGNYRDARRIYDAWFDRRERDYVREDGWVRLVAALDTESKCKILAHTGTWGGGGRTNAEQRAILRTSADVYRRATGREPDGFCSNGGSVGALQQVPTSVARAADNPWGGWGTIVDCMVLETSIPKFLEQLRVTNDPVYEGKRTASPIVADLLRVQRPLASEVAQNYGTTIVARAMEIAQMFPQPPLGWWPRWFKQEALHGAV